MTTPKLTAWGWLALILVLWIIAKIPLGNEIFRYYVMLLIFLLILINLNELADPATN